MSKYKTDITAKTKHKVNTKEPFANAKIALFDSVQGAQIELAAEGSDKVALSQKYADENADPFNAAQGGYIDAIIEPQFVRQYLIASLQMLVK